MKLRRAAVWIVMAWWALSAAGCATVKPWDRDLLARPEMRLTPHSLLGAVDDHIYFSKEGSTGGATAAGGGCGCN